MKDLINKPEPLFLLGYMLFPILALVCAGLAMTLIFSGSAPAGIALFVVMQFFTFGAVWLMSRRKRLLAADPNA